MMKYWPSLLAALAALAGIFETPLQGMIAAHPGWAAAVAGASTILAHLTKSPSQK